MTAAAPEAAGPPPRTVLIVGADLMTGGPLVAAVRAAGFAPVRSLSLAKADVAGASGVLLDLSLSGAAAWLTGLPADAPPVLSFGPHVLTELLRTARAAGRGPVLPRSRLADGVPAWLDGLK